MVWNKNSGYSGNRMSNRAVEAYDSGEKPLSKWTKKVFFQELNELIEYQIELSNDIIESLQKLNTEELKNNFVYKTSWHHTGSYCNKTEFYSIDIDKLEETEVEDIQKIIDTRVTKERVKKEIKANLYITALVEWHQWEGTRNHPYKQYYKEVVYFRSNDKLVNTIKGNKRLTSLTILKKVEQKTKFADSKKVQL